MLETFKRKPLTKEQEKLFLLLMRDLLEQDPSMSMRAIAQKLSLSQGRVERLKNILKKRAKR